MAFWSLSKPEPAAAEPAATMDAATLKNELGHAYQRGRTDERARRVGRGLLTAVLALLAVVGVTVLALGAHEGSFAAAGADVDSAVAHAMSEVGL